MSDERTARVHMALLQFPSPGAPVAPAQRSAVIRRQVVKVDVPSARVSIPLGLGFGLGPFGLGPFGGSA